jgi:N-acetylneuraminic acid mutarotase
MAQLLLFSMLSFLMLTKLSAQWRTGTNIPEGIRAGNTISYVDKNSGFVYLFGGRNDQDIISNKAYRYNISNDSWETKANLPTPLLGASSARIGENIFLIGGMVTTPGSVTKKVYKYNIPSDSWSQVTDTPLPYTDGDAVAYQDSLIYTVGSYSSEKTFVYNSITDKWREGTAVPSPGTALTYGAVSIFENKLVYVGGSNGTFSSTYWDKVWIGEIDQNDRSQITWTEAAPFPGESRTFFELQPWWNGLILVGGTTDNTFNTYSDETYYYNLDNDSWVKIESKPTAWNTGNAASLFMDGNWSLFCTGGFSTEYIMNTEIFSEIILGNPPIGNSDCQIRNFKTIGGKNPKLSFCTNEKGSVDLKIYDLEGRLILEKNKMVENSGNYLISLSEYSLSKGIYFVNLSQNGKSQSKKIQIQP